MLFLLAGPVSAAFYYADVEIDVLPTGEVDITGLTNHPDLKGITHDFTSKEGRYWLLNLTLEEEFQEYVFTVLLPEGANLNYVKSKNINILTEDNRVAIKGVGSAAELLGCRMAFSQAVGNDVRTRDDQENHRNDTT